MGTVQYIILFSLLLLLYLNALPASGVSSGANSLLSTFSTGDAKDETLSKTNIKNSMIDSKLISNTNIELNSKILKSGMKQLNIGVMTWNHAEKSPRNEDCIFMRSFQRHDIVIFGLQECEDIKPRRHEGRRSRRWRILQAEALGKKFTCVGTHKMGGIQLAVHANKKTRKLIEGIQLLEVACGVGNVLTNKGAICILVRLKGKTLAIINAHLAAHQTKVKERNADYHRIMNSISDRANKKWLLKKKSKKVNKSSKLKKTKNQNSSLGSKNNIGMKSKSSDLSSIEQVESVTANNLFDATIFLGDLNFRVDLPRLEIECFHEKYKQSEEYREEQIKSIQPIISQKQLSYNDMLAIKYAYDNRYKIIDEFPVLVSNNISNNNQYNRFVELIEEIESLLSYDQLRKQYGFRKSFYGLMEGRIRFPPSFKYDRYSHCFD
eukprot:gene12129-16237_t